ncbi:hypothetical protein [Methylomagnum ishizawai]|uniref:hypothetical protein n=1 Tax=Methylomagnum ishizawai TaxID=1760988 RepID=UPI001C7FD4F6|nr:hypothetical protein [Methylomagnum ishizawai]
MRKPWTDRKPEVFHDVLPVPRVAGFPDYRAGRWIGFGSPDSAVMATERRIVQTVVRGFHDSGTAMAVGPRFSA